MVSTPSTPELLKRADLRVTAIRTAVIDEVRENPHAQAEAIRVGVVTRLGSASVQSVYDALNALTQAQVLRRFELAGHPARPAACHVSVGAAGQRHTEVQGRAPGPFSREVRAIQGGRRGSAMTRQVRRARANDQPARPQGT